MLSGPKPSISKDNSSLPGNFQLIAGWIILSIVFLVMAIISFSVTTEDAYITFRYAENIASGSGPVFNEGGEVIEGYSNPTWTGVLAVFSMIGINTVFAARCLGLLFGALSLLEVMLIFRTLGREFQRTGTFAAIALATAPSFLFWSQTGLENALFIYLLVLSWRLVTREDVEGDVFPFSAIPLFFLAVTRPEGIMYSVIFGAWKLVKILSKKSKDDNVRLGLWIVMILIPFFIFLIWRQSVFGEWVPNTFFAKVNNGIRHSFKVGFRYIIGFLNHTLWTPLAIPVLMRLIRGRPVGTNQRRVVIASLMLAASLALFILYVGGDIHPNDRFGVPLILFAVVATFMFIPEIEYLQTQWWRRTSVWVAIIWVAANLMYSFPPAYGIEPPISRPPNFLTANIAGLATGRKTTSEILDRFRVPPVDALEFVGRDLHDDPDVTGLLAVDQCGKIPYYSELPILDLLGLNDHEIADIIHSTSLWPEYAESVIGRLPQNVVFVYVTRTGHTISRYYLENTVLSDPFRVRWELSKLYHMEYYFTDNTGIEHTFTLELVKYSPRSNQALVPLSVGETTWLRNNDPMSENEHALQEEVESFRERYADDPDRVVVHRTYLN